MAEQDLAPGEPAFWINTVSLEHVQLGVVGGFTQADHGRSTRLKRLRPGDGLVFYSPRTAMGGGQPLQEFTALGQVTGAEPYQVEMAARSAARTLVGTATALRRATRNAGGELSADFHPWRRRVDFLEGNSTPARPLVANLDFIADPKRWGYPFRRGLFEIGRADFLRIAHAMGIDWDAATSAER